MRKLTLALVAGLSVAVPTAFADEVPSTGSCGSSCGGTAAQAPATTGKDLVGTAVAAGQFKTLAKALGAADLVGALQGEGPFTVFAPTDAAFAKIPAEALQGVLADKAKLTSILTYHVVPGRLMAKDVVGKRFVTTLQGQALRVEVTADGVMVDGARVVATDVNASNGVIHVIDSVVMPRKDIVATAIDAGSFKTLVTAVQAADLVETLQGKGPFTVFAPNDAAFAKLPAETLKAVLADKAKLTSILTYHVVPGRILAGDIADGNADVATAQGGTLRVVKAKDGSVTVAGANVIATDIIAGNGVIHVVDSVLLPR